MATNASSDEVQRVVHHVFLPPQLPHRADEASEIALIDTTLTALISIQYSLLPDPLPVALENAVTLLTNIKAINSLPGGQTDETALQRTLTSLPVGRSLAVKVSAQNAAVLITRQQDELIFEEFELSPQNEAVVTTQGRLVRTFPGLAVAISAELLAQSDFSSMVSSTLSKMCHQDAPGMQPQSKKNGMKHDEIRDTAHPAIVSELLIGVLRGIGAPTIVSAVSKNTRDEVLYHKAKAPWRRSPMWLMIRVTLQLVITRSSDGSRKFYKEIMAAIMTKILKSADHLPIDMIYAMKAKIHRRLQKLADTGNSALPNIVMASINLNLRQVSNVISARWKSVQQNDSRDMQLASLATLDFEQDTLIALPGLDNHIQAMLSREGHGHSTCFVPSSQLIKYDSGGLPGLPIKNFRDPSYAAANLNQFEAWVAQQIDEWTASCVQNTACKQLRQLMIDYHALAASRYSGNPEATSIMVLTLFELWVACDKIAIRINPLVSEYDPGVPSIALQNLLLPVLHQMKRLSQIEEYLTNRRSGSKKPTQTLFDTQSSESFANMYFNDSDDHRALLLQIESEANVARQAKLNELRVQQARYHELVALCGCTQHTYTTKVVDSWCDPPETDTVHDYNLCQRCSYESERDGLSIEVHEWPLPSHPFEVKTIVFELQVPSWFAHWRDARLHLLQNVLKGELLQIHHETSYLLSSKNDPHLSKYFKQSGDHRIGLSSTVKPVVVSHYSSKRITTLSDFEICVKNALRYHYYDAATIAYVEPVTFDHAVPRACTYLLPSSALQRFIIRPASTPDGPEPNTVIASQDACPDHMAFDEYKELGVLPLGRHIQWVNILLQLAMPSVDFRKPETTLVFLQCIYQAGPSGSTVLRDSHNVFSNNELASLLVQNLTQALQRVKENWESAQAIRIFVAIAARALSLSASSTVRNACLKFLKSARDVVFGWATDLREKAYSAVDHSDRITFINKSVEVALICISTYDVDYHHLAGILGEKNNASVLVQTSIIIQEGEHSQSCDQEHHLALLTLRFKRLLHRLYKILAQHPAELDDAVRRSWSAYVAGDTGWNPVSEVVDHWLTTNTSTTPGAASMSVHYNLLSGELLVNGLPLNQPPKSYRDCPLYSTLFGKATVEVMPSTTPGFQFSTKRAFGGYSVELGMATSTEASNDGLVVRATKGGITYETIPSRLMETDYPRQFVYEYVHWFNAVSNTVAFRPSDQPWNERSQAIWTLSKQPGQTKWRLAKAGCSVAALRSSTSQRVSHVLDSLAHSTRIHSILQPYKDTLHIDVPELRMGFTLARGSASMESREFRSMFIDGDQSLGTFVGLRSKLILKPSKRGHRTVLIPESNNVSYTHEGDHTIVIVSKESIHKVHALQIDSQLGRLLDNGDLGCKLYLAYLHAITSFCLVDPLTRKTGTEQALTILNCAAVRSFSQLSQANIDILTSIAKLSPRRCYYPRHERVMQTVSWDHRLSFLCQHGHFKTAVKTLFKQADQAKICFPEIQLQIPTLDEIDDHLLSRDNARSATFRVSGFGAEDHTARYDQQYTARDHDLLSRRAMGASTMSGLIFRDGVELSEPALIAGRIWQKMCLFGLIHGPQLPIEDSIVPYDASLVENGQNYAVQRLPAFHRWLSGNWHHQRCKFVVIMWLSTMAFAPDAEVPILEAFAMMFKSAALRLVNPPQLSVFYPRLGKTCSRVILWDPIMQHRRSLDECPENALTRQPNEKQQKYDARRKTEWQRASRSAVSSLLDSLAAQWPCKTPSTPSIQGLSTYIRVDEAMKAATRKFTLWHDNRLSDEYLTSIEQIVSGFTVRAVQVPTLTMSIPAKNSSVVGHVSEQSLFLKQTPKLLQSCFVLELPTQQQLRPDRVAPPLLGSVIDKLETSASLSKYQAQYTADLSKSLAALLARDGRPRSGKPTTHALTLHLDRCSKHVQKVYDALVAVLTPSPRSSGAQTTQQWPRVSPILILQQLSQKRWVDLTEAWKECIVTYGLALAALQRAEQLMRLHEAFREEDFLNELHNVGHMNWDPMEYPDSLLMEVESGIMIREVQDQIAAQMRDPPNGQNAVMQLNMGEGKSSIIVPIVAAALANGNQLVRVLVAKPQSKQMAQMLISKLGGLLDRRVYYMPISRSLKLDEAAVKSISDVLHRCMSEGGILLVQPEHILSFKLMAPECYISGNGDVGREIMFIQDFLDRSARDIVDESDENFSVHFELIYTMGMQRHIEFSPDRWLLLQQVLHLVRLLAPPVAKELPKSLEYFPGVSGSFPRVRVLRPDAGELLLQRLANHICNHGLDGFPIARQPEAMRKAVYLYITKFELDITEMSALESSPFWTDTTRSSLLLIRGIIACGVLTFALGQKRWRVQYGLASRTPSTRLAVPYRAKDSPSPRSEFSHPDVVIILTSLCYYYGGISDDDLFTSMGHLMESDQPDIEYQAWVCDAHNIPAAFKQLQGINLKDRPQCISEVFPALRYAKSAIDYFLSRIVFPREMKEFPYKLSASGWDSGKRKRLPVTGFSGTNDSRHLLPLDVNHLDIAEQRHTNALVLEHILQPENGVELMNAATLHTSDAELLFDTVLGLDPPVQVIIDVGAQILELTNLDVAKTWLSKHDSTKQAAVYVDDDDDLRVVDRNGDIDLLRTSSFFTRLDTCLIFLDEAHTRGIDLQLPVHYRAAVTLGANLTKDRLVQACMRMRKLGKGQTVVFCISPEIQAKIVQRKLKAQSSDIAIADVLVWSMYETHAEVQRSMPLWAIQGERFVRQDKLWQAVQSNGHTSLSEDLAETFQEYEAQSLEDRYRPRPRPSQSLYLANVSDPGLRRIAERCQHFGDLQFNSSTLQEEQERELSPEIEQERQVQKAPPAQPLPHGLHQHVQRFATTGVFVVNSEAYMPAFQSLQDSSAAEDFSVAQLIGDRKLFVTADFVKTVKRCGGPSDLSDIFHRPVQWLLTNRVRGTNTVNHILVLSPYEANLLYRFMERSTATTLHVYKPLCNSGYASLDRLDFYTVSAHAVPPVVPRALAVQLALFAGQLYISSWADYLEICKFLGLSTEALTEEMSDQGWQVSADGFILSDGQGRVGGDSKLKKSPANFFKILMSKIRRDGDGIAKTHMGGLLEGKLFQPSDFED